jgi:hypothetical protein
MTPILDRLRQLRYKHAAPLPLVQVFFGDQEIAELAKREGRFFFRYLDAFKELGLSPIPGFPDVDRKDPYESDKLFPFFRERIPDRTRPEIRELIRNLGVPEDDELRLLAELSRHSVTDPFELKLESLNEESVSPGIYLQQRIRQKMREVAKTNNAAGYVAMWPEVVKEVLAKFPNLSPQERVALRGNIEGQIRLLTKRTSRDPHMFTPALQAVARILAS